MRIQFYPYTTAAVSAKRLSQHLNDMGVPSSVIQGDHSYEPMFGDMIVRWGNPHEPVWWKEACGLPILNHPEATRKSVNKLRTFQVLMKSHVPMVPWTHYQETARELNTKGKTIFSRTTVVGRDGEGLIVCPPNNPGRIPRADLYTVFVPSIAEFRVHVLPSGNIFAQRKEGTEQGIRYPIRTSTNGYSFKKINEVPPSVSKVASDAIRTLGLHFGGVDLLWCEDGRALILEVNTAPELKGTDIPAYCEDFLTFTKFYYKQ